MVKIIALFVYYSTLLSISIRYQKDTRKTLELILNNCLKSSSGKWYLTISSDVLLSKCNIKKNLLWFFTNVWINFYLINWLTNYQIKVKLYAIKVLKCLECNKYQALIKDFVTISFLTVLFFWCFIEEAKNLW